MWSTNNPTVLSLIPDNTDQLYGIWPRWSITIEWEHSVFVVQSESGELMRAISDWATVIGGNSYTKYSYKDTNKEFVYYVLMSKVSELISQYKNEILYYATEEDNHSD